MSLTDEDILDADIPMQAVKALEAATARTRAAGLAIVTVRDGNLVRIEGEKVTILEPVAPRVKVSNRQTK